ncbi:MAG: hypothetical protein RQ801_11020, partial [Spirochaetaceae bacterium]|nr:hypothetical protein [Spirochaetaceae bacterium]
MRQKYPSPPSFIYGSLDTNCQIPSYSSPKKGRWLSWEPKRSATFYNPPSTNFKTTHNKTVSNPLHSYYETRKMETKKTTNDSYTWQDSTKDSNG